MFQHVFSLYENLTTRFDFLTQHFPHVFTINIKFEVRVQNMSSNSIFLNHLFLLAVTLLGYYPRSQHYKLNASVSRRYYCHKWNPFQCFLETSKLMPNRNILASYSWPTHAPIWQRRQLLFYFIFATFFHIL